MNNNVVAGAKVINNKITTGAKVMNIKLEEDYIENNMIDLPFIFYYKTKEPITSITYSWVGSDNRQRAIEVRSSKHGVPDAYCYDVLLALFRLYIKQNNNRIIQVKDEEALNQIDNKIEFSFRELVKEMGYKSFSKHNKLKVQKGIEMLLDTTIYNSAGGIYNPISKEYIIDDTFTLRIAYDFKNYSYVELKDAEGNVVLDENGMPINVIDKKKIKDKCSIKIDRFFIKNLWFGNAKLSDKRLRLNFKNDISKKLYLILNKWRNNRAEMVLKYTTLYNRIPLTDFKDDYYRKRRLTDALKELKESGFIYDFELRKNDVVIYFVKNNKEEKMKTKMEQLLSLYNSYEEIMDKFKEYKIPDITIKEYFKIHKMNHYQALLRYMDFRGDSIEDKNKYLFKSLVNDDYSSIGREFYTVD